MLDPRTLSRDKQVKLLEAYRKKKVFKARKNLLDFTKHTFKKFNPTGFHQNYYNILNHFADGEIKKLIVTIPPQHGKSEGSSRRLPSYILGKDPDKQIAIVSYADAFAKKFNRSCQRIIDDEYYHELFPKSILGQSNVVTISSSSLRNATEFEIDGHEGKLKAVGRGGPLTGEAVDVLIMDDLYKDYKEGNSPVIRQEVIDWYITVADNRLHNDSQQLIVFTRWNEGDLIGWIEKNEEVVTITSLEDLIGHDPDVWVKINFEAIKTGAPTDIDPRKEGEPLYPEKHNLKKLLRQRKLDPEKFNCLHQGNPVSQEGLLYKPFNTYTDLPVVAKKRNITDPADKGTDYLCSVCYDEDQNGYCYVTDVLYTQDNMDITTPLLVDMLIRNNTTECDIEGNNSGDLFKRNIEKIAPPQIELNSFYRSGSTAKNNKESRIYSTATVVTRMIFFPENWHVKWPKFYDDVKNFKKLFAANTHDDAADVLTTMVEDINEAIVEGIDWE